MNPTSNPGKRSLTNPSQLGVDPSAKNRPVTLRDVGRAVGVSPATVSRVLSGFIKVRPNTRQMVLETVRELGYHPNPMAQKLARSRKNASAGIGKDGFPEGPSPF